MSRPKPIRLKLYDELACANGVYIADIPPRDIRSGRLRLALDHADAGLEFTIEPDSSCASKLLRMRVVRAELQDGEVHEFRIRSIRKGRGLAGEFIRVEGQPIIYDLGACGPILTDVSGATPRLALGASLLTHDQWIDAYVMPALAKYGLTWVGKGTLEYTAGQGPISFDGWSPLQLLIELANGANPAHELRLRRNGETGYLIDILRETGSEYPQVLVQLGRNVDGVEDQEELRDAITVAIARGIVPTGATERATIAEAVWKVTALTGSGPYTLTTTDPAGGPDFIIEDGQFEGLYIENTFGDRALIVGSTAPNQLLVADDLDLLGAAGNLIMLREDAAGTRVIELRHPTRSLPVKQGGLGRLVGDIPVEGGRGERNYAPNPFFTDEPGQLAIYLAAVGVNSNGTTLHLSGLPAGLDLTGAGKQQLPSVWTLSGKRDVATGAIVDGSGNVTLTMVQSANEASGEDAYVLFNGMAPEGWAPFGYLLFSVRDRNAAGTLTGTVSGVGSGEGVLRVTGLPPGAVLQRGDGVRVGTGVGTVRTAVQNVDAIADGTGAAQFLTPDAVDYSLLAGQPVEIFRPVFTDDGSDNTSTRNALTFSQHTTGALGVGGSPGDHGLFALPFTVRPDLTNTVLVIVGVAIANNGPATSGASGLDPAGAARPPSLQVMNVDTSEVLAEMWAFDDVPEDRQFGEMEVREFKMQLPVEISGETTLTARFAPISGSAGGLRGLRWVTHLKWMMVAATNDPEVPPVHGSWANALVHAGNRGLQRLGVRAGPRELSLKDLSVTRGQPLDRLHVGGRVWRRDSRLGISEILRMRIVEYSIVDQGDASATLDEVPETASAILARTVGAQSRAALTTGGSGGNISNVSVNQSQGLSSTINTWLDRGGAVYNIRAYGAVGDGTTDDTAAITAAINDAATAGGGQVFVPPGEFLATQIRLKLGVTLAGTGWGSQLRQKGSTALDFIVLDTVDVEKTCIRDLKLYGDKGNQATANRGILLDNTGGGPFDTGDANHLVQNVLVKEFKGTGVRITGTREARCVSVLVQACDAYSFETSGSTDGKYIQCVSNSAGWSGFLCDGSSDIYVGCKSFGSGRLAVSGNGAGYIISQPRIYLTGCESQENAQRGYQFVGADDCVCVGLVADSNGEHAYFFDDSSNNVVVGVAIHTAGLAHQHTYGLTLTNGSLSNKITLEINGTSVGEIDGSLANNNVFTPSLQRLNAARTEVAAEFAHQGGTLGFYNVTPVVRATHGNLDPYTNPGGDGTSLGIKVGIIGAELQAQHDNLNALITILHDLGLIQP